MAGARKRISLLSVVKAKDGTRYMAVDQIHGEWVDCAWFADGVRHTARFRLEQLEVVPALGADDERWRAAFRAVGQKREG